MHVKPVGLLILAIFLQEFFQCIGLTLEKVSHCLVTSTCSIMQCKAKGHLMITATFQKQLLYAKAQQPDDKTI